MPELHAHDAALVATHGDTLRGIAARAIRHGLDHGKPAALDIATYPAPLHGDRATFVTLEKNSALRGCIGSIVPHEPLALSVAGNAHAAAFSDPRFDRLCLEEWLQLTIAISLLSPLSPIACRNEAELLAALRPHIDGLVLSDGPYRGVFLPQVWETLPDPQIFVTTLKRKAGLPSDHWSPAFKAERFSVTEIPGVKAAQYG